jgi:hypothetical protein
MRSETLTAYGTAEDRAKLAVLAGDRSVSTWLIDKIRSEYHRLYGDTDPTTLRKCG